MSKAPEIEKEIVQIKSPFIQIGGTAEMKPDTGNVARTTRTTKYDIDNSFCHDIESFGC